MMLKKISAGFLWFGAVSLSGCGHEDVSPLPVDYQQPPPPVLAAAPAASTLSGVAQISGLGSHCTGFVIDHGVAAAPAYLLTNGHCVGLFGNQELIAGQRVSGTARFGLFVGPSAVPTEIAIDEVSWASMRGTDLAVLRSNQTLQSLKQQGINAYPLTGLPAPGQQIQIVGVPVQDLPEQDWLLRHVSCQAGRQSRLLEFVWLWDKAQAGDCPGILAGHSGSPVFDRYMRVAGIVNTTTIGAQAGGDCYLGKPCEVTVDGVTARENTSYWLAVDAIKACFNPDGLFDPDVAACRLEQPDSFFVQNSQRVTRPPAGWQASLAGPATISLKAGPLHQTDCRSPAGYQGSWQNGELYQAPLPANASGHWLLCAAGFGPDGQLQTTQAGFATLTIDNTPPQRPMRLNILHFDDSVSYAPLFSPPELSSFRWKSGAPTAIDCADPSGYQIFRRIPRRAELAELPLRVCLIGSDEAGNESAPLQLQINRP